MAKEKLITLPLLNLFKTKMQEWTSAQDETLKTELLGTIGNITSFEIDVVDSLPETGTKGHIYFVPKTTTDEKNIYDEYIWVVKESASAFEKIGDTKIDTDALKSETLAEVSTNYIKTVTVVKSPIFVLNVVIPDAKSVAPCCRLSEFAAICCTPLKASV